MKTIILSLILIGVGIFLLVFLRKKITGRITEIKFVKTSSIKELKEMFDSMAEDGLENSYRHYVELKGVAAGNHVKAPFSKKNVVYCESSLSQVEHVKEQYRDKDGNLRTRTTDKTVKISEEKTSETIQFQDSSSNESVVLELNAGGCKLDIPKTYDRFIPRNEASRLGLLDNIFHSGYRNNSEITGYKAIEKTIHPNQNLYVLGEAFKAGDSIHIGKPMDKEKEFIISTKSEEELINTNETQTKICVAAGVGSIVAGVIAFVTYIF